MSETIVLPEPVCDICKKEINYNQASMSLRYCGDRKVEWCIAHTECLEEMNKHSVQFKGL